MKKQDKEIAELAVNKAEEICKSIEGFEKLSDDAKAIAIIFASISVINTAYKYIKQMIN